MPTYRWTFTCEEMYDDENETVNITTKTLVSDSETFTDVLILLPQLFNGAGFFVQPETFSYKDATFEDWAYEKEETQARVLERDRSPPGFVGDFSRWTEPPHRYAADPGIQVTGTGRPFTDGELNYLGQYGDNVDHHASESVDFLAGFPPTMSEE